MPQSDKHFFIIHYKSGELLIKSTPVNHTIDPDISIEFHSFLYDIKHDENIKELKLITSNDNIGGVSAPCFRF
jgi:hypothetical protein